MEIFVFIYCHDVVIASAENIDIAIEILFEFFGGQYTKDDIKAHTKPMFETGANRVVFINTDLGYMRQ